MNYTRYGSKVVAESSYDVGLRAYMLSVYQNMFFALLITAVTSILCASSSAVISLVFATPLRWIVLFAPLIIAVYLQSRITKISSQSAKLIFFVYAALIGVSLSYLFIAFSATSIARAFFVSASVFGAMSIYGYTTKKDLTSLGSFMFMGLIGIIIASVVNLFSGSGMLAFIISIITVFVFVGLTAYDTQKIKYHYYSLSSESNSEELAKNISIYGALQLYLDFINIFVSLLQILGDRK